MNAYPAPSIEGVAPGSEVDPSTLGEAAIVRILKQPQWYPPQKKDSVPETLLLHVESKAGSALLESVAVLVPMNSRPMPPLEIPVAALLKCAGQVVRVFYSVGQRISEALVLSVKATFASAYTFDLSAFDYSPVYQYGKLCLPSKVPDFARFSRAAVGATAYSSSRKDIATVDSNGTVTAWRNGQTTIVATDAKGEAQRYHLTIQGIAHLEILESGLWNDANALCMDLGLRLPRVDELSKIYERYLGVIAPQLLAAFFRLEHPRFWCSDGAYPASAGNAPQNLDITLPMNIAGIAP